MDYQYPETVEGDVLHVTLLNRREIDAWAWVSASAGYAGCYVKWLAGGHESECGEYLAGSTPCDEYEVVPAEEWPDEICAAVALYQMGLLDPSNIEGEK
jgi:hypothetical protein